MKQYKLKLTALTPIHIGSGEVYQPTNFVIDAGYLFEFEETAFYRQIPESSKKEFNALVSIASSNGYELFEKIHAFIVTHKDYAKEVSFNKVKVSEALETHYKKSVSSAVQAEGKGNRKQSVFTKFEIKKTQRLINEGVVYLPGSSIKGAISTAYQEYIFKQKGIKGVDQSFDIRGDKLFRNLSISDAIPLSAQSQIGYAINQERFETQNDAQVSTIIEVNSSGNEYMVSLSLKELKNDAGHPISETITKDKIIEACNRHYKLLHDEKELPLSLNENQFLLCIGKHSGARAVTIEGARKILVKLAQIQNKKDEGDDPAKRIERLHKKSYFEHEKISSLQANPNHLNDKERRDWENAKKFLESPAQLEWLIKERKSFTLNAILTEETTMWRFGESKSGKNLDSFGWVLCEFLQSGSSDASLSNVPLIQPLRVEINPQSSAKHEPILRHSGLKIVKKKHD